MDKKTLAGIIIVFAAFTVMGYALGKGGLQPRSSGNITPGEDSTETGFPEEQMIAEDVVQVYLFHPTHRCTTCITIGRYARETVTDYYQEELAAGKIEFREINMEMPENEALVSKFQASGSSLFINARRGGKDSIAEDADVWRLAGDEAAFKDYLKGKLDNLLGK
jgi:hypothetical protein